MSKLQQPGGISMEQSTHSALGHGAREYLKGLNARPYVWEGKLL